MELRINAGPATAGLLPDSLPPEDNSPMTHWIDELRPGQDVVAVPRVWLMIALSILIHIAILFLWVPRARLFNPGDQEEEQIADRLQVQLAAEPTPPPQSLPPTQAPPPPPARPPRAIPRTQPPPVVRMTPPETPVIVPTPAPPAPPAVATPRPSPPVEGDLAAYVQARRRERGEAELAAVEDEAAKFNRTIAANLPAPARGSATQDAKRGGGIFQIKRMTYDDAAFEFYGWNTAMGRKTPQLIEVRKGMNSDMRIAVVRRMIVIIREYEKEDFTWESQRLGRNIILSARLSDTTALETFMMHEFFDDAGAPH
jgi:outer membrane biosynthesis protein TonB